MFNLDLVSTLHWWHLHSDFFSLPKFLYAFSVNWQQGEKRYAELQLEHLICLEFEMFELHWLQVVFSAVVICFFCYMYQYNATFNCLFYCFFCFCIFVCGQFLLDNKMLFFLLKKHYKCTLLTIYDYFTSFSWHLNFFVLYSNKLNKFIFCGRLEKTLPLATNVKILIVIIDQTEDVKNSFYCRIGII